MENQSYKIIDNFLNNEHFNVLKNIMFKEDFFWNYNKTQVYYINKPSDGSMFFHRIFNNNRIIDHYLYNEHMLHILDCLNCNALINIKANMYINVNNRFTSYWHTDHGIKNAFTAIFYMNNNNGYTLLDEDKKIKIDSVENRMVIFNSFIKHCAIRQTDEDRRVIINFNYIQNV